MTFSRKDLTVTNTPAYWTPFESHEVTEVFANTTTILRQLVVFAKLFFLRN
jgi:hypothetical protein